MEQLHSPVLVDSENTVGFLNRARLGTGPLAGFPSLTSLPHFAVLDLHDVNVYGTESTVHKSRNNSVSVKLNNTFEGRSAKDVAEDLIGGRIFTGWPFWWEGLVATVSDSSFRYEKFSATATVSVVARRHTIQDSVAWKSAAQRIEWVYSNRKGVATGPVHVLLHVRPLTGTTVRENGDVVKVYGPEREAVEHAVQTCSKDPALEDPRFMEIEAMPLEVMYPKGTPMIYLGGDAYGAIAHVRAAHDESLSILLEVSHTPQIETLIDLITQDMPLSRSEAVQFKSLTRTQTTLSYLPSYRVAYILNITPRALSRITSSFLVTTSDKTRVNVGLNMKFDAKSFKVIGYTRKDGRHWEYSQKAIDLISDYKVR
jgi:5'-3' exoribonuclease 1